MTTPPNPDAEKIYNEQGFIFVTWDVYRCKRCDHVPSLHDEYACKHPLCLCQNTWESTP